MAIHLKTVSINFNVEKQVITIDDPTENLVRQSFFAAFLRQKRGDTTADGEIVFPSAKNTLDADYQMLRKVLDRCGYGVDEADDLTQEMRYLLEDEARFEEFTEQARLIWESRVQSDEFRHFASALIDRCPGRTLYPLQLLSAFHLAFAQNACNFSVPGSGKTSIVYGAYAFLNSLGDADKYVNHILVVGPLSSFKAWEEEFKAIFQQPPNSYRLAGSVDPNERRAFLHDVSLAAENTELTLTSYQTLCGNEDDFRIFLSSPHRHVMMVLDEAHYIKRDDGVWAAAALRLAPLAKSRVVLTGTPAPNGYEDLSNLFRFIYPNRKLIRFHNTSLRAMTAGRMPGAVESLKKQVKPFFTRIRRSDLNLPTPEEFRISVGMSDNHREIYSGIERLIIPSLRNAEEQRIPTLVRARLIRLRQAATNPALLLRPIEEDGTYSLASSDSISVAELTIADRVREFAPDRGLERLRVASELVERILSEEGKVLIWSIFIGNLSLLKEHLSDHAEFVDVITGMTPVGGADDESIESVDTRESIIDRFHRDGETSILIANPQAVGESISLHKACDTAIYFDRDFNAGRFIQSKDRIHRYDTAPRSKRYFFLVAANTVDEDIDDRLEIKERRMHELIDSDDIPLFGLMDTDNEAFEDIRAIIRSYEQRKAI